MYFNIYKSTFFFNLFTRVVLAIISYVRPSRFLSVLFFPPILQSTKRFPLVYKWFSTLRHAS